MAVCCSWIFLMTGLWATLYWMWEPVCFPAEKMKKIQEAFLQNTAKIPAVHSQWVFGDTGSVSDTDSTPSEASHCMNPIQARIRDEDTLAQQMATKPNRTDVGVSCSLSFSWKKWWKRSWQVLPSACTESNEQVPFKGCFLPLSVLMKRRGPTSPALTHISHCIVCEVCIWELKSLTKGIRGSMSMLTFFRKKKRKHRISAGSPM